MGPSGQFGLIRSFKVFIIKCHFRAWFEKKKLVEKGFTTPISRMHLSFSSGQWVGNVVFDCATSEVPCVKHIKEIVPGISGHSKKVFIFSISLLTFLQFFPQNNLLYFKLCYACFVVVELNKSKQMHTHKTPNPTLLQ